MVCWTHTHCPVFIKALIFSRPTLGTQHHVSQPVSPYLLMNVHQYQLSIILSISGFSFLNSLETSENNRHKHWKKSCLDHVSQQQKTALGSTSVSKVQENNRRLAEFCCDVRMVGSELGVNMKAVVEACFHPTNGCGWSWWWRGGYFLTFVNPDSFILSPPDVMTTESSLGEFEPSLTSCSSKSQWLHCLQVSVLC